MLGGWFSGIGATAAVVYAVNTNRSGLKCYSKITNEYSKDIEVELFNHKQVKAHIIDIKVECLDFNKYLRQSDEQIKSLKEHFDYCIEPGHRLKFTIKFNELMELYFGMMRWYSVDSVINIPEIKISIYVLNGSRIDIKITNNYYTTFLEKFKNDQERNIMTPNRGYCYIVPSNEIGKSDSEIMGDRIERHIKVYGNLIRLLPPKFRFINQLKLLKACYLTS